MNAIPAPRPVSLAHQLKPKGIDFTRIAIALAAANGKEEQAAHIATLRYGDESLAARILKTGDSYGIMTKASVVAGGRASGNWAAELVSAQSAAAEFFGLVRQQSVIGRIDGLRRVPLQVRLVGAATGFDAAWVGEGQPVPLSSATYDEETLAPLKLAALCVVTNDLLESADPAAELLIRNDLVAACVDALNTTFLDPSNAGSAGVSPASITNGAPSLPSTGDGLADIRLLIDAFPGNLERAILIGSPQTLASLHDPERLPGLGVRGGDAIGIPAISATAAGDTLVLLDPDGIAVGELGMALKVSSQSSIQMLNNPTNNPISPTATSMVSLFQANSTAIMAEKIINFAAGRPSVSVITGVAVS